MNACPDELTYASLNHYELNTIKRITTSSILSTNSERNMPGSDFVQNSESIENVDETLRSKYLEILQPLNFEELKRFNKARYKKMIKSDIMELLPDTDPKVVDDTAHYISNTLNNEAVRLRGIKRIQNANTIKSKQSNSSTDAQRTEPKKTAAIVENETSSKEEVQVSDPFSDTFLQELDNTMCDANDSLNSTISVSQLDATYDMESNNDDSITKAKSVIHTRRKSNRKQRDKKTKTCTGKQRKSKINQDDKHSITCTDTCDSDTVSTSIRCNLCMYWFHANCVNISDIDSVGAWVCSEYRKLPQTVNLLKTHLETLLESTTKIVSNLNDLRKEVQNKFTNVEDRLTQLSNQQKHSDKNCTNSLADIRQDVSQLRTDVDKKSNVIQSKSQTIVDKVNAILELVSNKIKEQENKIKTNHGVSEHPLDIQPKPSAREGPRENKSETNSPRVTSQPSDEAHTQLNPKKPELTLITGSCILKGIETKFLAENVRVKSFKKCQN